MIHKTLKKLRKQNGVNQAFIAGEIGVSRPTYISIEKGERDFTFGELCKLSKFFNCRIVIEPEYCAVSIDHRAPFHEEITIKTPINHSELDQDAI